MLANNYVLFRPDMTVDWTEKSSNYPASAVPHRENVRRNDESRQLMKRQNRMPNETATENLQVESASAAKGDDIRDLCPLSHGAINIANRQRSISLSLLEKNPQWGTAD